LNRRPPSSAEESFHSALDFGQEWYRDTGSGTQTSTSSSGILGNGVTESPSTTPVDRRGPSFLDGAKYRRATPLTTDNSVDSILSTPVDEQHDKFTHERFFTAPEPSEEQAEEWDKTRAAKRVSLVKLPSELKLSSLLGRHGQVTGDRPAGTIATSSSAPSSPARSGGPSGSMGSSFTSQSISGSIATLAMQDL